MRGTTDSHAVDTIGGILMALRRVVLNSDKRGSIWDLSGIGLDLISRSWFNTAAKTDTTGGSTNDGFDMYIPCGVDAGELAQIQIQFGVVTVDLASTGDLAGYTGIVQLAIEMGQPDTYFAYREVDLGASGVIGINGRYTQPPIPVIPNFALIGGFAICNVTNRTTALAETLSEIILQQADDYLLDVLLAHSKTYMGTRIYNALPVGYQAWRHAPVANDAATQLTLINGATATVYGKVVYAFQSGLISKGGLTVGQSSTPGTGASGAVAQPNPARALPTTQRGPTILGPQTGNTANYMQLFQRR
jgi:hypothetical protein